MNKMVYCKKCGSPIDNGTKKCTGCGKQYFNIHKFTSWKIISITLAICLCITFGFAYRWHSFYVYEKEQVLLGNDYIQKLDSNLKEYQDLCASQKEKIADIEQKRDDLHLQYSKAQSSLSWYEQHAGICTPGGTKYHTYDCYHWKDSDYFWIYNTEAAEQHGYDPCLDCH